MPTTGKSDKPHSVFFNGRSGPWWRVAAVIFAAGAFWAKVDALERSHSLFRTEVVQRLVNVEKAVMASAKGTN